MLIGKFIPSSDDLSDETLKTLNPYIASPNCNVETSLMGYCGINVSFIGAPFARVWEKFVFGSCGWGR